GERRGEPFAATASFLIDATGPASILAMAEGIDTRRATIRTNCWAVYSHFTGLDRWENLGAELAGSTADYPFPCDEAAIQHSIDEGWIWVLPFNNSITSAGVAFAGLRGLPRDGGPVGVPASAGSSLEDRLKAGRQPEAIWAALLAQYPAIDRQ